MAKISIDEVRKLARLSKLKLTTDEETKYQKELSTILEYVDILKDVDVADLEPTSQVTGLVDVFRDDVEIDYEVSQAELLSNAPLVKDNQFVVKRMVG